MRRRATLCLFLALLAGPILAVPILAVPMLAGLVLPGPALAVQPDEVLDDPALEERARALSLEIRCLVCQNQSIDDSNADLARDLRILVRERLVAGDSDQEVRDYLVERYGPFVLLEPPTTTSTYLLWYGPLGLLLLGGLGIGVAMLRRRGDRGPAAAPLSAEERARVNALLDSDDEDRRQ